MSGSSGGGGGGGGTFVVDEIACDRLQFETDIRSPNPAMIAQIQLGDVLDVQLRQGPPNTVVLVFRGQDVGGIVSPKATRLRECLASGTSYNATVIAKRSANVVSVRIAPKV